MDLTRDGLLDAEALHNCRADGGTILAGLQAGGDDAAGWAILAGVRGMAAAIPQLLTLADGEGLTARAASWALGRLDAEQALLAALETGGIDLRSACYQALCTLAARGAASAGLADAAVARVAAENERARSGASGLGDQACRLLAVLGDPRLGELIGNVLQADPYADRFELQRLNKAAGQGGRDTETIAESLADWPIVFAAELTPSSAPDADADTETEAEQLAGRPEAEADGEPSPDDAAPDSPPLDWEAFMASPEATALPERGQQMIGQLGPMLEQLVARSVGVPLTALKGQELAAVLLQVLPQALPPQYVQAALAPEAINAYQALCKYLVRTGLATEPDLLDGITLVREQLTASMRASGMLGGPDYSDPDAAATP